ncbi:MAG TPA: hypothetical protein PLV64_05980 [Anaerolineales bacterium]|nr:hypothetical protein [Anaerolineales bacterium]
MATIVVAIFLILVVLAFMFVGKIFESISEAAWENKTCSGCGRKGTIKTFYEERTGSRRRGGYKPSNKDGFSYDPDDYEEYKYSVPYKKCANCGKYHTQPPFR